VNVLGIANPFGAPVYHAETVVSTMLTARELLAGGAPHGTVITADFQEAGRGRSDRPWKMRRGENLMFTIILRYPGFAAIPPALTLRTGLAISLAVEDFAPALRGRVAVKWPNDIMLAGSGKWRKCVGILTDSEGGDVCIGVGANVLQREFPPDIQDKAGSIAQAAGNAGPPVRLLAAILPRLYAELSTATADWRPRLEARLYRKGESVTFLDGPADKAREVRGTLAGIGPAGELLITPAGEEQPRGFVTGELRVYN
jgi:BirA family biotin operon repressor/biotin-[acetyl-CoA-carboxylase] ligase